MHQECYGGKISETIPDIWFCDRCIFVINQYEAPKCLFCPNLNGALKSIGKGNFSHVLCVNIIPEIRFNNLLNCPNEFVRIIINKDKKLQFNDRKKLICK